MNKLAIKMTAAAMVVATGAAAWADDPVPEVTKVTMTQISKSNVKIEYTLANGPAIITLDIETNNAAGGWASIGGEHIWQVTGDCWKKVAAGTETRTIKWIPCLDWPDHKVEDGGCRAVVKAWALDNPPDYMVVDVSATAAVNSQKYYPAKEFLPGGLLANPIYRTTSIVMRKIMAQGVTWTMGTSTELGRSTGGDENAHQVTLDANYYIGVFEVTQSQWALVQPFATGGPTSWFTNEGAKSMRPMDNICFNEIRLAENKADENTQFYWPTSPYQYSFLGKLRTKTGISFDLPSEAQWEFACRAGTSDGHWNDGSAILSETSDSNLPGRHVKDGRIGGTTDPAKDCEPTQGTALVGTYAPNAWGLYDMHGNVAEFTLDWWLTDITSRNGAVVKSNERNAANRIIRGGSWVAGASYCRSAKRGSSGSGARAYMNGCRLACPVAVP